MLLSITQHCYFFLNSDWMKNQNFEMGYSLELAQQNPQYVVFRLNKINIGSNHSLTFLLEWFVRICGKPRLNQGLSLHLWMSVLRKFIKHLLHKAQIANFTLHNKPACNLNRLCNNWRCVIILNIKTSKYMFSLPFEQPRTDCLLKRVLFPSPYQRALASTTTVPHHWASSRVPLKQPLADMCPCWSLH